MRANRGIGDDAIGRARPRVVVEFCRIELDDKDFVEPRAAADHSRFGILGPGVYRRTVEFQIRRLDDLSGLRVVGRNQKIILLWAIAAAGFIVFGAGMSAGDKAGACRKRRREQ